MVGGGDGVLLPRRPPYLAPPKTSASHRSIPLPNGVVTALADHLARFGTGDQDLVFTTAEGNGISRTRFSESVWIPAVTRARLPKGTRFHDYADLRVMPTWVREPMRRKVIGLLMSA